MNLYGAVKCAAGSIPCMVCLPLEWMLSWRYSKAPVLALKPSCRGIIMPFKEDSGISTSQPALTRGPLNRVQYCRSAVDAVPTLPDLRRPHVGTHPDCVWTCGPMTETTLITSSCLCALPRSGNGQQAVGY